MTELCHHSITLAERVTDLEQRLIDALLRVGDLALRVETLEHALADRIEAIRAERPRTVNGVTMGLQK